MNSQDKRDVLTFIYLTESKSSYQSIIVTRVPGSGGKRWRGSEDVSTVTKWCRYSAKVSDLRHLHSGRL